MTITCAHCGRTQLLPELPPGTVAECGRCDRLLRRTAATNVDAALASSTAVLLLLPPAVFLPFLESTIRNWVFEQARLVSSVPAIYRDVWFPFAFGFLFFAILFPAIRALLLVIVLGSVRLGARVPHLGRFFRWSEELRMWSMSDIVVVAGVVTYLRATAPADVRVLSGTWFYLAVAVFAFTADHLIDRRAIWNAIVPDRDGYPARPFVSCVICELTVTSRGSGDSCPRCGATLEPDLVRRFIPAVTTLAAALPLAVPAYGYAVMLNDRLTAVWEFTIFGTVELMAERGYWQLALVLLVAGVVVPLFELVGLGWLILTVRFPRKRGLVLRTRIYRRLRDLVRWPMIIPFIVATSVPIVDFPAIDDIIAGPGATPFFMLIVMIMFTMRLFEPRLMWRTAGAAR